MDTISLLTNKQQRHHLTAEQHQIAPVYPLHIYVFMNSPIVYMTTVLHVWSVQRSHCSLLSGSFAVK